MRKLLASVLIVIAAATAGAQELHVNDSGTWRKATEVHVNDSGTWRNIQEVWVNDGGTWRLVFRYALVTLSGETTTGAGPGGALASINFRNDGGVFETFTGGGPNQVDASTDWIIPNAAAPGAYEIRATLDSGPAPTGDSTGAWLALSTGRTWTLSTTNPGTNTTVLTVEIRDGSATVVATNTYTLEAIVF